MNETKPLTWKSILVLSALIVVSAVTVLLVAWSQRFSLHGGFGLLVGVLAVLEIGYLFVLVAMSHGSGSGDGIRAPREQ